MFGVLKESIASVRHIARQILRDEFLVDSSGVGIDYEQSPHWFVIECVAMGNMAIDEENTNAVVVTREVCACAEKVALLRKRRNIIAEEEVLRIREGVVVCATMPVSCAHVSVFVFEHVGCQTRLTRNDAKQLTALARSKYLLINENALAARWRAHIGAKDCLFQGCSFVRW